MVRAAPPATIPKRRPANDHLLERGLVDAEELGPPTVELTLDGADLRGATLELDGQVAEVVGADHHVGADERLRLVDEHLFRTRRQRVRDDERPDAEGDRQGQHRVRARGVGDAADAEQNWHWETTSGACAPPQQRIQWPRQQRQGNEHGELRERLGEQVTAARLRPAQPDTADVVEPHERRDEQRQWQQLPWHEPVATDRATVDGPRGRNCRDGGDERGRDEDGDHRPYERRPYRSGFELRCRAERTDPGERDHDSQGAAEGDRQQLAGRDTRRECGWPDSAQHAQPEIAAALPRQHHAGRHQQARRGEDAPQLDGRERSCHQITLTLGA